MRISDWSSDVCSSDLRIARVIQPSLPTPRCTPFTVMASDSPSDQVRPDADVVVGLRLAARVEFFVFARPLHDEVLAPARMNERDLGIVIEDRLGEIAAMNRIGARAVAVPPEHAVWQEGLRKVVDRKSTRLEHRISRHSENPPGNFTCECEKVAYRGRRVFGTAQENIELLPKRRVPPQ